MFESRPEVAAWTVEELNARIGRGDAIAVLDVREAIERQHCTIPLPPSVRDLHIPLREVPDRLGDLHEATADDRDLVVYCHHGVRSMAVATLLAGQGLRKVHSLAGGIDAWSERIDPGVRRY